jgi:hypothetical protein
MQFKDESEVANLLLRRRHLKEKVFENHVNFISISDSDASKISYLSHDRILNIQQSSTDDYWISSKRFHCKPGALVNKLFKNISSKEVEKFSNLFKSFSNKKEFEFELVHGENISEYYHQNSYSSSSGSLGNSCMKYQKCQSFLGLYTQNPDVISMLIMKSPSGQLLGRALIWNIDGQKVMDRIYTVQDEEYAFFFKQWAKQNDCHFKTFQNWNSTLQFDSKTDSCQEKFFKFKLKNTHFDYYPYLDTFKWIDTSSGYISNSKFENSMCISSADGTIEGSDLLEFDDIDRVWAWHGNLIYVENSGIRTRCENLNYSTILDTWMLKTESKYVEEIDDFVYIDDSKNDLEKIESQKINIKLRKLSSNKIRTIIERNIFEYSRPYFLQDPEQD